MDDVKVTDRPDSTRFEARLDGELAGFAAYILTDELIVFTHTEVQSNWEGRGVGSALARAALDDVRARSVRVLPLCPFIAAYIRRHPEYTDLVVDTPPGAVSD